jgi:hypothetical protein
VFGPHKQIVLEEIEADSIAAKEAPPKAAVDLAVDREKNCRLRRQEILALAAFEHVKV